MWTADKPRPRRFILLVECAALPISQFIPHFPRAQKISYSSFTLLNEIYFKAEILYSYATAHLMRMNARGPLKACHLVTSVNGTMTLMRTTTKTLSPPGNGWE